MKKISLFLILLLISKFFYAQRVHDFFTQSSANISYVKKQDSIKIRITGSGFLIFVLEDTTTKLGKIFLITNKHVLPNSNESKTITIKVPSKTEKGIESKEFNIEIYGKNNALMSFVKLHKNKNVDVAGIDITYFLTKNKLLISAIPSEFLFRKADYEKHKIGLGDEVFIIGYPSSIYDNRTVMPIVRQGIISSNPYDDFYFNESLVKKDSTLPNPLNGFLIDGSIFPGSSGSLVLLKTSYEMTNPKKFSFSRETSYVLGIISRNITTQTQSIDLGIAFNAECIAEIIDEFYLVRNK